MSFDPAWEMAHRERLWGIYYDPRLMTCVWRQYGFVDDRSAVRIIEIGCGVGAQTREMARCGYSVLGIDGSPSAIARAEQMAPPGLQLGYTVGDVTRIGEGPDGLVDCVVDVACLEAMDRADAEAALRGVARVLKPDGWFFSIHKAKPWEHTSALGKVGKGSRSLDHYEADGFYSLAFEYVRLSHDVHTDSFGQVVQEWIVECKDPRK